ncbi:MAG: type IV secretory system conjugative DNA transfer family protein [Acidobacteriota bacterium]|nr:type IV secretory system conjugative DNA transfer family protein [Acidobacteriota bacterium]
MNVRPPLGVRFVGPVAWGPTTYLERDSSLLVVGPTQSGKTSSLVVPAILNWRDALVVTSVKRDVVATTREWREALGQVTVLEPGEESGLTFNPMEGLRSLRHASRVARDLTLSAGDRGEGEFWNALATKLVAALMVVAASRGANIFEVARVVERRALEAWARGDDDASAILRGFLDYEPRTLDSVLTTAETMLYPWRFPQPLAAIRRVVHGANTLYLCAPQGEQRHYEALFRGALRAVLDEQQRRVDQGRSREVLFVLDEAATVASLDELDQLAATVRGLGVTLVTVVQDFAQLRARWGERASSIVNNHATRVVLAGLADPTVGTYLPELVSAPEGQPARSLRRAPGRTAFVVSGRRAPYRVRLRPWWRVRGLRDRGTEATKVRFAHGPNALAPPRADLRH